MTPRTKRLRSDAMVERRFLEMREELAGQVRHLSPILYPPERIDALLARAKWTGEAMRALD